MTQELSEAITAEVARRDVGEFNPMELCNIAWSFAKSGYETPSTFHAIEAEVTTTECLYLPPTAVLQHPD